MTELNMGDVDICGTSRVGVIYTDYDKLVAVFGEPNGPTDGDKVDAQWLGKIDGHVFTIYNYKDGKNYLGDEGEPVERITDWHVGGRSYAAYNAVDRYLTEALETQ